jgi:integrase
MHDFRNANGLADAEVEPIRSLGAIAAIKDLLSQRPRDLLLFTLGINNGVRAGDLLRVTVNDVRDHRPGGSIWIRDKHAGKAVLIVIHREADAALRSHLGSRCPPAPPENMYLFADHEGWTPLTTQRLDALVKEWTRAAGLPGTYGAHSLRKTFGYIQRTRYGVGFDVLAERFNHSSATVTMRYLGFSSAEEGLDAPLAEI